MHDLPAQHRAARRVRKAARLQEQAKEEAIAAGQDPGPQIEYKEDWAPWVLAKKPGRRKKEDEIPKGMIPKDMYRAFNYSAIMCIGMCHRLGYTVGRRLNHAQLCWCKNMPGLRPHANRHLRAGGNHRPDTMSERRRKTHRRNSTRPISGHIVSFTGR
jgi:hypothetical protein